MSELIAAKGVIFRETRSGEYLIDWHNAPRRQFVVNLTGEGEIEVSDGGKRSMFHSFTRVGDIRRRTSSLLAQDEILGLKPRSLGEPRPESKRQLDQKRDHRRFHYHSGTGASSRMRFSGGTATFARKMR